MSYHSTKRLILHSRGPYGDLYLLLLWESRIVIDFLFISFYFRSKLIYICWDAFAVVYWGRVRSFRMRRLTSRHRTYKLPHTLSYHHLTVLTIWGGPQRAHRKPRTRPRRTSEILFSCKRLAMGRLHGSQVPVWHSIRCSGSSIAYFLIDMT